MKRVKLFILLPAISLLFALPQFVYAADTDSQTFSATKDSYANEAYPDKVNGGYDHLIISNKYTTRLVYLQFEEINLPEGAILDNATLKFYVYSINYADTAKLNIGPVSGDWSESSLTWNNKPTINQTQATEAEISLTDTGWKQASVTNIVRQWLEGNSEDKGIFMYPYGFLYAAPETEFAITFRSRKASENNPQLEVTYHFEASPEPSTEPSPSPEEEREEIEEEEIIGVEEPSPESSPSPSPKGKILGIFSPGQAAIAGLIALALIGAIASFLAYARKPKKEKPKKKKKTKEKPAEEKGEEEVVEESSE